MSIREAITHVCHENKNNTHTNGDHNYDPFYHNCDLFSHIHDLSDHNCDLSDHNRALFYHNRALSSHNCENDHDDHENGLCSCGGRERTIGCESGDANSRRVFGLYTMTMPRRTDALYWSRISSDDLRLFLAIVTLITVPATSFPSRLRIASSAWSRLSNSMKANPRCSLPITAEAPPLLRAILLGNVDIPHGTKLGKRVLQVVGARRHGRGQELLGAIQQVANQERAVITTTKRNDARAHGLVERLVLLR